MLKFFKVHIYQSHLQDHRLPLLHHLHRLGHLPLPRHPLPPLPKFRKKKSSNNWIHILLCKGWLAMYARVQCILRLARCDCNIAHHFGNNVRYWLFFGVSYNFVAQKWSISIFYKKLLGSDWDLKQCLKAKIMYFYVISWLSKKQVARSCGRLLGCGVASAPSQNRYQVMLCRYALFWRNKSKMRLVSYF